MNKEDFDNKYVGKELSVRCKTEDLANEFLILADSFGYKWRNGCSYLFSNCWNIFEEYTCYRIFNGLFESLDFCESNCFNIIEFKGESMEFKQEDLKTGMVVERRNGEMLMFLDTELSRIFVSKNFTYSARLESFENFKNKFGYPCDIIRVFSLEKEVNLEKENWGTTKVLWEEKSKETTMTIKEIEEKLGVSNLRITK